MTGYTYRVSWSPEDQEFVGTCDEFPSLSWLDGDEKAALAGIKLLVAEGVAGHGARCEREYTPHGYIFIDCLCSLRGARAEAWDEGHHTRWVPDHSGPPCQCFGPECRCGNCGVTKPAPNPYRS